MVTIALSCVNCNKTFNRLLKRHKYNKPKMVFCSVSCRSQYTTFQVNCKCASCASPIVVMRKTKKKSLSGHNFCSQSCAASYNNKHKTHGNRRSKLEKWLEEQLTTSYPNLEIHFNRKDAIGSELDIYIPSLRLAFELNGIFHYEPIYGQSKLDQVQNNDVSKSKLCHEAQIDLCVIDTSHQKYFKPKTSQIFLDIVVSIVNGRL